MVSMVSSEGAFGAAAASHPQIGASPNIIELKNFAQTLGLTAADVRSLEDKYAQRTETSTIVEVACLAAQLLLGADQVDTAPLNQSTVEENWYVRYPRKQLLTDNLIVSMCRSKTYIKKTFLYHPADDFEPCVECHEDCRLLPGVFHRPKRWPPAEPGLVLILNILSWYLWEQSRSQFPSQTGVPRMTNARVLVDRPYTT
jgi:hypothetical protein